MDRFFWPMVVLLAILFYFGLQAGMTHDTHLSDIGQQTNVTINPCPILSGYLVTSDQRDCYLIYKQIDLQHSAMHVQDMPLTPPGECLCPTLKGDQCKDLIWN
jgi:hypothetical protein